MRRKTNLIVKTTISTILLTQLTFSQAGIDQKSPSQDTLPKPRIQVGEVSYGGNGCPAGTSSEIKDLKFDKKIVFEPLEYELKIGLNTRKITRKRYQRIF